ncbi:LuxR family transcriptional regulator [Actinoplanes sp. NPDC051861]|uniref:helix-turn-helix transcriptional regulator n=1 Tax=Actinoplanes sp. NPDC051861 TaxID=3155170 RepID=UPI00343C902F
MVDAHTVQKVGLSGRDADLAAIGRLLATASAGHGGALVLAGAPGEGRTALLDAVVRHARGWTVMSASGHPDERAVAYAGIAQLDPAFCVGTEGDLLTLGLAVKSRWGTEAARRPLLCVLDDAHLLDEPTWRTVLFVARRLGPERIAILASVAAGAETGGLPVRRLAPLHPDAARELLARRAPDLADEVAVALVEVSGGNPAALIDLADALSPEQRRGYAPPPETLPPASGLRQRYRAELHALPERTRELVLLAAAAPQADLEDVLAASTRDAGLPDFEPAERAGLVTISGDTVRFASPLLRACAYAEMPANRRRAAHIALAGVLAARGAHLPALLHRAAATTGPDVALARQLARSARAADPAGAAQAQARAADLHPDPADRGAVLVDAARSAWLAGRPHDAGLLIRRVPRAAATAQVRARALTAEMRLPEGRPGARDLLLDVAADLADSDTPAALDALALAGEAAAEPGEQGRYAGLARRVAARRRGDEPPALALAYHHVAGLAGLADGDEPAAFARFRRALDLADRVREPGALIRAATAGILVGDARRAGALAGRAAVLARESGAPVLVPRALELASLAGMAAGDYTTANVAALDGAAIARATGQRVLAGAHLGVLAVLAALVGDRETALRRIEESGAGAIRPTCGWALALLDLVEGRFPAATERLVAVMTAPPVYGSALVQVAVVPHLLEAAAQMERAPGARVTGHPGMALGLEAVATGFDRWAGRTGQPAWLALRDRCRALRAREPEAAEVHFEAALGHTGEAGFPRAHTELLYGRFLRRRRRHVEARTQLRRAADTFRLLDAEPWAAQSVRELRAAGERVDQPAPALTGLELTAQQERIAALVAGGATNREVAQELHLSPRTVDHHLRNVFARLGVRSRTEMARLLNTR